MVEMGEMVVEMGEMVVEMGGGGGESITFWQGEPLDKMILC